MKEKNIYEDESKFSVAIESNGIKFYKLNIVADTHTSRFLAASANDRFASLGITETVLENIENAVLKATENKEWDKIAVLVHNLRARRTNPVDEYAAIRMAAIYHYIDGEDPNAVSPYYTEKKFNAIKDDPKLFDFFLPIGLQYTPSYADYLQHITHNSLEQRALLIHTMQPS